MKNTKLKNFIFKTPFKVLAMVVGLSTATIIHAGGSLESYQSDIKENNYIAVKSGGLSVIDEKIELSSERSQTQKINELINVSERTVKENINLTKALEKLIILNKDNLKDMGIKVDSYSVTSNSNKNGYEFWISILLACIAVIITTLGVAIAILAFVGYKTTLQNAKDAASTVARETTAEIARNEISERVDDGSFNDLIEEAVDKIVFKGIATFPGSDEETEEGS